MSYTYAHDLGHNSVVQCRHFYILCLFFQNLKIVVGWDLLNVTVLDLGRSSVLVCVHSVPVGGSVLELVCFEYFLFVRVCFEICRWLSENRGRVVICGTEKLSLYNVHL
jgi:hypothetical protein